MSFDINENDFEANIIKLVDKKLNKRREEINLQKKSQKQQF